MVAIKRLSTVDADFQQKWMRCLLLRRQPMRTSNAPSPAFWPTSRARGDAAVVEYTNKFDRLTAFDG